MVNPSTSSGSGRTYNADKKETLKVLSEKYNPSFAKKLIESVSTKMVDGGVIASDGKTINVGDLVTVNSKRNKQYKVKEINGKENVKVVYNDGSEYVTTTSDLKKFVFVSNRMANGGGVYSKDDSIGSAKRVANAMRSKMMKKKS